MRTNFFIDHVVIAQWVNGFKLKECKFSLDIKNTFFYDEGGKTLYTGCPESW